MTKIEVNNLGPVLDLIERWQQMQDGSTAALGRVDVPALRALCEQHAAQLRNLENQLRRIDRLLDEILKMLPEVVKGQR